MTQLFRAAFSRAPNHREITEALSVAHTIAEIMGDLRCPYDRAFDLAFRAPAASGRWRVVRYLIQDHADQGLTSIAGVRRAATLLSRAERKARGEAEAKATFNVAGSDTGTSRKITFESLFGDAL